MVLARDESFGICVIEVAKGSDAVRPLSLQLDTERISALRKSEILIEEDMPVWQDSRYLLFS